jgi:hypothetical protein
LIAKINAEKAQEHPNKKRRKGPVEKLTDQKVAEILQNIFGNAAVKIDAEVIKSWQVYNNANSELKNAYQVKEFIEEIKSDEVGFVKHLEEQPGIKVSL